MRQDEGEHAQGTGARVHGLRVVQAAGRHNEEMSRDGYGVARIPTNSHTGIQTHFLNIPYFHSHAFVHTYVPPGNSKSMERAFMALFPLILDTMGIFFPRIGQFMPLNIQINDKDVRGLYPGCSIKIFLGFVSICWIYFGLEKKKKKQNRII